MGFGYHTHVPYTIPPPPLPHTHTHKDPTKCCVWSQLGRLSTARRAAEVYQSTKPLPRVRETTALLLPRPRVSDSTSPAVRFGQESLSFFSARDHPPIPTHLFRLEMIFFVFPLVKGPTLPPSPPLARISRSRPFLVQESIIDHVSFVWLHFTASD